MRYFIFLFISFPFFLSAQQHQYQVIGQIFDAETNEEIMFATIVIEGTTKGVISDESGIFHLKDNVPILKIEIRLPGYESQVFDVSEPISPSAASPIREFRLKPEERFEYRYKPYPRFPFAQQYLKPNQKPKHIQSTPFAGLQGTLSGISITSLSGDPASASSIRIRGHNHITQTNEPLYVIDGMEIMPINIGLLGAQQMTPGFRDPLRFLSPDQIRSITFKKGPASASYGQRGANGVVHIYTQEAETRKFFSFQQQLSVEQIASWPHLVNKSQYENWATSSGLVPDDLLQGNDRDWLNQINRLGLSSDQQLSMGGTFGKSSTPYRLGVNIHNRQGSISQTGYNRLQFHFTTSYDHNNWSIPITYTTSIDQGGLLPTSSNGMPRADLILNSFSMNPTLNATAEPNPFFPNPSRIQENVAFQGRSQFHMISFQPNLDLGDAGDIQGQAFLLHSREETRFDSPFPVNLYPFSNGKINTQVRNNQLNTSLSYKGRTKNYRRSFRWDITWQSQFQWRNIEEGSLSFYSPFAPATPTATPNYASFFERPAVSIRAYHAPSANFKYFYQKGIDFAAGLRAERLQNALDFTHRVPENWQLYPYATLGIDIMGLVETKGDHRSYLRFAYGEPGWGASRTQAYNVGWDFAQNIQKSWLNAYISGRIDVYRKHTSEVRYATMLTDQGNPNWQPQAVGTIRNEGIELSLSFQPQFRGNKIWAHTALHITFQRNELLELADSSLQQLGRLHTPFLQQQQIRQLVPGQSIGSFYLPSFQGWDANGNVLLSEPRYVGQGLPRFFGGVQQRLGYKTWLLSILIEGAAGFEILNDMATAFGRQGGLFEGSNFFPSALENELPPYYEQPFATDQIVERGDYLRLSNISLQYRLEWLKKDEAYAKNKMDFTFSVQNLWLWTNYSGNDPALALGSLWGMGQDYVNYPMGRIWTLGIAFWK